MYDVIILGNGLTGGLLACTLAQKGFSIALIDQKAPFLPLPSEGRSFALSQSSARLLRSLNLWDNLGDVTPIRSIHISDGVLPRWVRYEEQESGKGPLGYVVESSLLKAAVLRKVLSLKNVSLHAPTAVCRFEQDLPSVLIETTDKTILKAPLCVGSEGRTSLLREKSLIPLLKWTYNQIGIVCTVAHTLPHYYQAFEHFLPSGPLALIPREGKTSGVVWSIETTKAASLLALSPKEFAEEVEEHFKPCLGSFSLVSKRWAYPLGGGIPRKIIDNRLALIGDAAHSFHPVAGQGLNVGIRDVTTLTSFITEAASLGLDIGSYSVLERYQTSRMPEILSMAAVTDSVVRFFSTQNRVLAHARSLGFLAVKHFPSLKNFMIRRATNPPPDIG